jgi:hypothetical protein
MMAMTPKINCCVRIFRSSRLDGLFFPRDIYTSPIDPIIPGAL